VSRTTRINLCVQVEDVRLSRKVLYHFAIFVIINEILIFEDFEEGADSRQALAFANGPAEHASFRQSSKINISLIITKIAKW